MNGIEEVGSTSYIYIWTGKKLEALLALVNQVDILYIFISSYFSFIHSTHGNAI